MPKKVTPKITEEATPAPKKAAAKTKATKKVAEVEAVEEVLPEVPTKPAKAAKAEKVVVKASDKKKTATIKKFQNHASDTGSSDVQVAVLTQKINLLSQHLTEHKKDNDSRSGLLKMISHRRSLLSYLEKRRPDQYRRILAELGLRK